MHVDLCPQIPAHPPSDRGDGHSRAGAASRSRPTTSWPPSPELTDELGGQCFLVTGDKDCRQLITDRVKVYNIRKNQVFDRQALREDWGIAPEQVVDFQALVGDSVDNVPGVPLIGPKFARQLLEQYGTLEAVLDHAGDVPGGETEAEPAEVPRRRPCSAATWCA